MHKGLAVFLLLLTAFFWGITFPLTKDGTKEFGVLSYLAIRFSIGALVLLPFALRSNNKGALRSNNEGALRKIDTTVLKSGVVLGAILFSAFYFQTVAMRGITASISGLITALFFVFAILFNRILFRVKICRVTIVLVVLSLIGLLTLVGPPSLVGDMATPSAPPTGFGVLLATLGSMGFGLHIALLGRWGKTLDSLPLATVQLFTIAVLAAIIAPAAETIQSPSPIAWQAILIGGLVCSSFCYFCQTFAQRQLTTTQASLIIASEPIFAVVGGVIFHHDHFSLVQGIGAGLMMFASFAILLVPEPQANEER
ncbi:MAG: DMT family transporter [Thermoguttaceae bacterium]